MHNVPVDRRVDPSRKLPVELRIALFGFLEHSDRANLRLMSRELAAAGMADILAGRGGKLLHLHFGVEKNDLRVLDAILSNDEISSQVGHVSLGCAYFDESDGYPSNTCVFGFHGEYDLYQSDGVWTAMGDREEEEDLFKWLGAVLMRLKELNKKRRCKEHEKMKKAEIVVHYGCTYNPVEWHTLPHGLRKLVRKNPPRSALSKAQKGVIFEEQGRFIDWALFALFTVIGRMDPDTFKNGEVKLDLILKGKTVHHEIFKCFYTGVTFEGKCLTTLANRKLAVEAKSRYLMERLPNDVDITRKISHLVGTITWLNLPEATIWLQENLPGYHSFGYSKLMQLLYTSGRQSIFKVDVTSPLKAASWLPLYNIPFDSVKHLELSNVVLPNSQFIADINSKCGGLASLRIRRSLLHVGGFDSIVGAFSHPSYIYPAPRQLELDEVYQKHCDIEKLCNAGPDAYYSRLVYNEPHHTSTSSAVSRPIFLDIQRACRFSQRVDSADEMAPKGAFKVVFMRDDPVFLLQGVEGM